LYFYWTTFFELAESRQISSEGDSSPLLLSEFLAHAHLYDFSRQDAQVCWEKVKILDRAWLTAKKAKQSQAPKNPTKK
jgi:hypothetical protein